MRLQSGLSIKYLGECVLTASYIINRLPSPVIDHQTHYACLYKELLDYSLLKVFGCLSYASVHETNKFSPRAIRSVFIGKAINFSI